MDWQVKVMKGSPSPAPVYVPVTKPKTVGPNPEKPRVVPTTPANAPETTVPNDNSAPENNESHDGMSSTSMPSIGGSFACIPLQTCEIA